MSKDVRELLPFYVNGTLGGAELKEVETAIKSDPSLKGDIDFLKALRDEVKNIESENSPGELGLKRLQKAIAAEKLQNDPIARAESKITKEQNWGWRVAAIAACLLLVFQTIVMMPQQGDDLTAAGGKQVVFAEGRIVSVTFSPDAREENIRSLLLSVDANIVDGPSALGVYKLSIPRDFDAAVEKLRAHKTLIETVDYDGGKAGQ